MNTAKKIENTVRKSDPSNLAKAMPKRSISGVQFKAVQNAVKAVVHESVDSKTTENIVRSAVYGIKPGERAELLLQVVSEKIVDARHVQLKMIDGGNRNYIWNGTTGEAARLRPGQVVLLKASAIGLNEDGMNLKHCRVIEVG